MQDRPQGGFTYIGLLFAVAILSIAATGAGVSAALEARRERERELLFVGGQFRNAIRTFYESTPGEIKQYPARLQDLLLDRRGLVPRRHLRQIYMDPISRDRNWGLVTTPAGAIMGVHSRSSARPLKQAGFDDQNERFVGAQRYSGWRFVYTQDHTKHMPAVFSDNPR